MFFLMNMSFDMLGTLWKITTAPIYPLERVHKFSYFMILWDAHFEVPCPINVHVQNNNYCIDVENKQFGVMGHDDLLATLDTRATPNKPAASALKNTSPVFPPNT